MDLDIILQQLTNGLVLGSVYGLVAIGYTLVYGILGMINFAHGDVYMVSAYLTAIFAALVTMVGIDSAPVILAISLLATVFFTGLCGWAIERVAYRPLRTSTKLAALISAIGISLFLQNFVQATQGARAQALPTLISGAIQIGTPPHTFQVTYAQLILITVAVTAMAALNYIVQRTSFGRESRATQQDDLMAAILGIKTQRVISTVFVVGSVMAALAGTLVTLNYGSFDFYIGFVTGIKAFTAAVLGGIGSLPGAMLGGLILGTSESLFSGFVSTDYKDVFAFALLIFVLIIRPHGLLGRPAVEKV